MAYFGAINNTKHVPTMNRRIRYYQVPVVRTRMFFDIILFKRLRSMGRHKIKCFVIKRSLQKQVDAVAKSYDSLKMFLQG
jgi:hypothetical protein